MKRIVGKCGHCGGRVTVPTVWLGINPPVPQCESCHAQVDTTAHLPTLPMKPRARIQRSECSTCDWLHPHEGHFRS